MPAVEPMLKHKRRAQHDENVWCMVGDCTMDWKIAVSLLKPPIQLCVGAAWIIFNEIRAPTLFFFANLVLKASDLIRFTIVIEVYFGHFFPVPISLAWFSISATIFSLHFVLFCFVSLRLRWNLRLEVTESNIRKFSIVMAIGFDKMDAPEVQLFFFRTCCRRCCYCWFLSKLKTQQQRNGNAATCLAQFYAINSQFECIQSIDDGRRRM